MFGLSQTTIEAIKQCFEHFEAVEKVILYGSRAKGNYRLGSDIDLAIIDKNMIFNDLLRLENEIDDLLLPYKMDISLIREIENPDLLAHIERVGKVFYEKNK